MENTYKSEKQISREKGNEWLLKYASPLAAAVFFLFVFSMFAFVKLFSWPGTVIGCVFSMGTSILFIYLMDQGYFHHKRKK